MLEYLCTPLGPNIPSPSELMGRQFRGLLPLFQDHDEPTSVQEQVMLQKEREKCRHDAVAHDLPVVPVGATLSYTNKDLKTWSIVGSRAVMADPMWWPKRMVSFGMPATSPSKPLVPR